LSRYTPDRMSNRPSLNRPRNSLGKQLSGRSRWRAAWMCHPRRSSSNWSRRWAPTRQSSRKNPSSTRLQSCHRSCTKQASSTSRKCCHTCPPTRRQCPGNQLLPRTMCCRRCRHRCPRMSPTLNEFDSCRSRKSPNEDHRPKRPPPTSTARHAAQCASTY